MRPLAVTRCHRSGKTTLMLTRHRRGNPLYGLLSSVSKWLGAPQVAGTLRWETNRPGRPCPARPLSEPAFCSEAGAAYDSNACRMTRKASAAKRRGIVATIALSPVQAGAAAWASTLMGVGPLSGESNAHPPSPTPFSSSPATPPSRPIIFLLARSHSQPLCHPFRL